MTQTREAGTRPDRSMSLLVDMMSSTLDAAYAEAAARRAGAPAGPGRGRSRPTSFRSRTTAVLLLVALGLVTGIAAAQVRQRAQTFSTVRAGLVAEVQRRTADTDRLAAQTAARREEVARLQQAGLAAAAAGQSVARRLAALELTAGTGAVRGPGVTVRLDDAPADTQPAAGEPAGGAAAASGPARVLDRDLQDAANGLWAAGAEAVSINDLRLTTQTAIRSAGAAILVDFRPLTPPYVLRAIGNPALLPSGFADGAAGRRLASYTSLYGLRFAVTRSDDLSLPGAGFPTLRFAAVDRGAS